MKKWIKKIFLYIGICFGIFLILMLALGTWAWIELQKVDTQKYLGSQLVAQLPEPWRKNAEVGRIGGRLPGSFLIKNVHLTSPNGDRFQLENIEFGWDWKELWHKQLKINSIDILKLSAELQQDPTGIWLPDLQNSSSHVSKTSEETTSDNTSISLPEFKLLLKSFKIHALSIKLHSSQPQWKALELTVENYALEARIDNSSQNLHSDISTQLSFNVVLDQYPRVSVLANIDLQTTPDRLTASLKNLSVKSPYSKIQLMGTIIKTGPWLEQISQPELLVQDLKSEFKVLPSSIATREIQPYIGTLLLPDDINLSADLKIHHGEPVKASLIVDCGKSHVMLDTELESLFFDPNQNHARVSLQLQSQLNEWVKECQGLVSANIQISGIPNLVNDLNIEQHLTLTEGQFDALPLPSLNLNTRLMASQFEHQLTLSDDRLNLSISATADLSEISTWETLDANLISFKLKESLEVPSLEILAKDLKKWIPTDLNLSGNVVQSFSGSGNLAFIQYQLQLQGKKLFAKQALPNLVHMDGHGKLHPQLLMQEAPVWPKIFQDKEHWQEDSQSLGKYVNTWLERIDWPSIQINSSGNQWHPEVETLNINVQPGENKDLNISIQVKNAHSAWGELQGQFHTHQQGLSLSLNQLNIHPQALFVQQWPWIDQALQLKSPATFELDWNRASMSWHGLEFGQKTWFSSEGEIQGQGPWSATLHLDLPECSESLNALGIVMPYTAYGHFELDLKSTGHWWRPECELHITSKDLSLQKQDFPALDFEEISLSFQQTSGSTGNVQSQIQLIPKGEPGFFVSAHMPLNYSSEQWLPDVMQVMDFQLGPREGKALDLGRFSPLLSDFISDFKGQALLSAHGQVDLKQPEQVQIEGQLDLENVKGKLIAVPQNIDALDLSLTFNPKQIQLKRLSLNNKDGYITAHGIVSATDMKAWNTPQWDLTLLIKNWKTQLPPQLDVTSNANLALSGNLSDHQVLGVVKISDLTLKPELDGLSGESVSGRDPNITFIDPLVPWQEFDTEKEAQQNPQLDILKTARIGIDVELLKNNWIRHDMFTGELAGSLHVGKLHGQDMVHPKGTVHLQRSVLRFQGKRFNMEKGDLIWQGELIPAINMQFETRVEPYDIQVTLQADQADLAKPELSSRPWLDNSDIISVLLIGRPLHADNQANNSGSDTLGQDIALSQGAAHLSKQMGLENMGIEIEDVNSKGGTVRVGRYLLPRLYVSAAKTMGDEERQEVSVEFLILKNLRFKTTQETDTPLGFDLEWTLDY